MGQREYKGNTEVVDAPVAGIAKRASAVGHRIPTEKRENRKLRQLRNKRSGDDFHGQGEEDLDTLLEEGCDEMGVL